MEAPGSTQLAVTYRLQVTDIHDWSGLVARGLFVGGHRGERREPKRKNAPSASRSVVSVHRQHCLVAVDPPGWASTPGPTERLHVTAINVTVVDPPGSTHPAVTLWLGPRVHITQVGTQAQLLEPGLVCDATRAVTLYTTGFKRKGLPDRRRAGYRSPRGVLVPQFTELPSYRGGRKSKGS